MNKIKALKPLLSKTMVWKIDTLTFQSISKILICYHLNEMALEDPLKSKCTIHFLGLLKRKFVFEICFLEHKSEQCTLQK